MSIWSNGNRVGLDKPDGITDAYIYFNDTNLTQKIPNASVFGIAFYSPHLDYFIDCEEAKDCWTKVVKEPYPKIFRKVLYKRKIAEYPGTYFCDLWMPSRGIENCWHTNPLNPHMLWVGTTIGVLLNLVIFMGYTRIHFVNCDCSGYPNYSLRIFLFEFNELCKAHGVTCISHDSVSPLNMVMEYQGSMDATQ